jgi:hypothetical protein
MRAATAAITVASIGQRALGRLDEKRMTLELAPSS